jgi:glycosyltransferase involved in cell wall biosynthesis
MTIRLGIEAWGLSGPAFFTGMGQYTALLLRHLPEVDPEMLVFAYAGPDEPRPGWLPFQVEWRPLGWTASGRLAGLQSRTFSLPARARWDRIDLFHATGVNVRPSQPPIPALACPIVATIHDAIPLTFYGTSMSWRLRAFYAFNLRRALAAEAVVTVSHQAQAEIAAATGIDPRRISVIPNGIDFRPNPDSAVLAPLGVRPPYILYAGSYEPRKNLTGALLAYSHLVREGLQHDLVAVVEESSGYAAAALALQAQLGLGDRVRFVHSLPEPVLRSLYTHADLLFFPSLAEGFGYPAVQAAACSLPVAASALPVLRELLSDWPRYFDSTSPDAMAATLGSLLRDQRLLRRMAAGGPGLASRYSARGCALQHLDTYRTALATGARRIRQPA